MNRYEQAIKETQDVMAEWYRENSLVAIAIVDRLVAKGIIQSTDPDDLQVTQ